MNEPTEVEARFGADGAVTLLSFTWQGRTLRVTSLGRQWMEREVRHFLVMVAGDRIFELGYSPPTGQWHVIRAPELKLSA